MTSKILKLSRLFFNKGLPPYLIFLVTSKCNAKCKMCFYWQNLNKKKNELSLEEIKKISKNLSLLQQLTIGGGEPFLRKDLVEICKTFYQNNDAQMITIPTNGLMPRTIRETVERLLIDCPKAFFRISISLDGIKEDHDNIRGVKGNFDKAIETYKELAILRNKYKNLGIDVSSVISYYNKDKIKSLFKYVNENLNIDNHNLILVRGDTKEKIAKEVSINEYKETVNYVRKLKRRKENRPFSRILRNIFNLNSDVIINTVTKNKMIIPCVAGKRFVSINEIGEVYPCELLNTKLGDLRKNDYDLKKILSSDRAKNIIKGIKRNRCFCTWECSVNANIIYHFKYYPKILLGR